MTAVHPKLAARRRRMHNIRVTVVALAAALFIALFSTLYIQMATGNDPALASSGQTAQASTSSSSTSSDPSGSGESSDSGSSSAGGSSPMTTSAS